MTLVSVPVLVVAGITFYIGVYHLGLHLRRPSKSDLYFAGTCALMALYDVFSALLYDSPSVEDARPWQRLQFAVLAAAGFAFAHFVSAYAKVPLPRWVRALLWLFPLGGVVALVERRGWVLAHEPMIKQFETSFGTVRYNESALGPLFRAFEFTVPLLVVFVTWIALVTVSRGERRRALPLLLAAGLVLGGLMHDMCVMRGIIDNIYIAEFSWFGVMFLMSASLSNEIVEAAVTREALHATQERIGITLDAIQDAVITTDNEGRVAHMNPAAEKLLGLSVEEAANKPLRDLITVRSAETGREVRDPIQYALSRPPDPYGKLPVLNTAAGAEFRVDQGGSTLKHPDGRVMGAVVVYRDLTVQQQALEQLSHADRMQSVGRLAGGVAHDLNNLLTPIISYTELARQKSSDQNVQGFLDHVFDAADRAATLTRQLLALSRKQILDVRVTSLADCVERSEPLFRRLVPDDIELEVDISAVAGNVRIDAAQFEQVLMNLVANARDAMPHGGRLKVSVEREHANTAAIVVRDDGIGMDGETQEHIFEPFFTTKERGKGTGLGLATVRGVVEQHGGKILVESELGVGTTIRISLPLVSSEAPEPYSARRPAPSTARGSEAVLVVEDDPAVRELAVDALRDLGYVVYSAANERQAREIVSEHAIDLLLSDVVLPGSTGAQVHQMALEHQPGIRCLFMSGHADDLLGERGFLTRGIHLIRKPFTLTALSERVRAVLDQDDARSRRAGS